jgi:hypothetical protein
VGVRALAGRETFGKKRLLSKKGEKDFGQN